MLNTGTERRLGEVRCQVPGSREGGLKPGVGNQIGPLVGHRTSHQLQIVHIEFPRAQEVDVKVRPGSGAGRAHIDPLRGCCIRLAHRPISNAAIVLRRIHQLQGNARTRAGPGISGLKANLVDHQLLVGFRGGPHQPQHFPRRLELASILIKEAGARAIRFRERPPVLGYHQVLAVGNDAPGRERVIEPLDSPVGQVKAGGRRGIVQLDVRRIRHSGSGHHFIKHNHALGVRGRSRVLHGHGGDGVGQRRAVQIIAGNA